MQKLARFGSLPLAFLLGVILTIGIVTAQSSPPSIPLLGPVEKAYQSDVPVVDATLVGNIGVSGASLPSAITDLQTQITNVSAGGVPDGSITSIKLADEAVIGRKIAPRIIAPGHLGDAILQDRHFPSEVIDQRMMAANSIGNSEMRADAINYAELAPTLRQDILELETQLTATRLGLAGLEDALPDPIEPVSAGSYVYNKATNGDITWVAETTGGVGGLNQSQVDARVVAGVQDWALTGNTDTVPDAKIAATITRDTELPAAIATGVSTGVLDWAETSNTDVIPAAKVDPAIDTRVETISPEYIDVEPGVFNRRSTGTEIYHVTIHGYPTTAHSDVDGFRIIFQGQTVHTESSWTFATGTRVVDFDLTAVEHANVARNLRDRTTIEVRINFTDGGTNVVNSPIREVPVFDNSASAITYAASITWTPTTPVSTLTMTGDASLIIATLRAYDTQFALLRVTQDSTGGHTLTLGNTIETGTRTAAVNEDASAVTMLLFGFIGSTWHYLGALNV